MTKRAMVVLSGGQDSTTCLFWAKSLGYDLHAITFDYCQRHVAEIDAAKKIADLADVTSHEIIRLGPILKGTSPLVSDDHDLEQYEDYTVLPGGLEKTFVPMRNQLFLTIASNRAFVLACDVLITGVCEEDYGGYPDCRREFIDAIEAAGNLGTFTKDSGRQPLEILTPLMYLTKAATVRMGYDLPGCWEALAYSHTAYDGHYPPTGKDHATLLREKGFAEAGLPDPLVLRAYREGLMELPKTENYRDAHEYLG